MANLKTDGMEDFLNLLISAGEKTEGIAKKCVYSGANVIHDAVRQETLRLPVPRNGHFIPGVDPLRVITEQDRQDLADSLGISRIRTEDGVISVSVSFDGYITRTEEGFPNGVPAVLIARSIEKGSSVRAKHVFVRKAVNAVRKQAVPDAMQATLNESIEQIKQLEG